MALASRLLRTCLAAPTASQRRTGWKGGERRWQTLGLAGGVLLLLVAHTVENDGQDEIIRIISARRADRKERKRYEKERQKNYS